MTVCSVHSFALSRDWDAKQTGNCSEVETLDLICSLSVTPEGP